MDVGGDDRGALALGRLSQAIAEENNYDLYMVINYYRPLTRDIASILEVRQEIEIAGRLKFTGVINNSNLGAQTDEACVLDSVEFAKGCAEAMGLPLVLTTVEKNLYPSLVGKIENLYPLTLQKRPV